MPTNPYGLADLRYADRRYRCATGTEEISFSVYAGALAVAVNKIGEWKSIWRQTLNPIRQRILSDHLAQLITKTPGFKDPIVFSRWDADQKKHIPEWSIELQKDDKQVYHIVISWKGNRHDAVIRGAYGVAFGADNIKDPDASYYGIEDLRTWLNLTVPIQMVLTNRKRDPNDLPANGQGRSSNGNGGSAKSSGEDYF